MKIYLKYLSFRKLS